MNVLKYFIFRKCPDERKVWWSCDEMYLESQYWHTYLTNKITNTITIIITVTQLHTSVIFTNKITNTSTTIITVTRLYLKIK